jgi:glycosyltransferase involved in cell wall biosynthesis
MAEEYFFKDVTLLVTHYNRSRSLERLFGAFKDLHCRFEDIVVSDDGSKPEHVEYAKTLQQRFPFRLITAPVNKGLGNNLNKGQAAVQTKYTLYVQEDFVPTAVFPKHFKEGLSIIEQRDDIDMVRFYAYTKYPYLKPLGNGYGEMQFGLLKPGYMKFHYYSDHPHLRRSNFYEKFGPYPEGKKMDQAEYMMAMAFLHKKGKAVQYENINELFEQKNSSAEPSMVPRDTYRTTNNFIIRNVRHLYRHFKYNFDYLFKR